MRARITAALRHITEARVVFTLALAGYLTLAVFTVLVHGAVFGDAVSRVGNAQYVLFSRDPHLAAIGFVWNPLPSLVLLPLLPLRAIWPEATGLGFIGAFASCVWMAVAVTTLRGLLADLGCRHVARWGLTAAFAVHPMIVIYGANGMSEAPLLALCLLTARGLAQWLRDGRPAQLVRPGIWLALAYLTRYESLAMGLAVTGLVCAVTLLRAPGGWPHRRWLALNDAAIVGAPFGLCFGVWTLTCKIIVGSWFPTFSSEYGNASQVGFFSDAIRAQTGRTASEQRDYLGEQILGLQPTILVILVLATMVCLARRDVRPLAAVATLGAVFAFDAYAFLSGQSFGWLRFNIALVPLAVVLAGRLAALRPRVRVLRPFPALVALALVAIAVPVSWDTLHDPRLAREETQSLGVLLNDPRADRASTAVHRRLDTDRAVAEYIDSLGLPDGAVLTDAAIAWGVLVNARDIRAYVITPDRDFQQVLQSPGTFGTRYVLVAKGGSQFDTVSRTFDGLGTDQRPESQLIKEWETQSYGPTWQLYELHGTRP